MNDSPLDPIIHDVSRALRSAHARIGSRDSSLGQGVLSPGDAAELRRMRPNQPPAAFWKVVARFLEPSLPPSEPLRSEVEKRWSTVLGALAACRGRHSRSGLGAALVHAGISEARVETLLRARGETLAHQVRAVAQLADSEGVPLDFVDLADLVLHSASSERGERVRRSVARRFYGAQRKDNT